MAQKPIPIYGNSDTDTHCVQAALQMVLDYLSPEHHFTLAALDKETHHDPEGWTWDTSVLWFLARKGYRVHVIDPFDLPSFAAEGVSFLQRVMTPEDFALQQLNADLAHEAKVAQLLLLQAPNVSVEQRPGTWQDIHNYHHKNWVVIAKCNSFVLDDEVGFDSHYLVVTDITQDVITVNDCGNPPQQHRPVSRAAFENARTDISGVIAITQLKSG